MKRYALNPAVSLREKLDGALLYNPDRDDIIVINETGRLIWETISKPRAVTDIAAYLKEQTEDAQNVQADVEAFIESLLPNFLVVFDEAARL